jgi:ribokinase
VAAPAAGRVTGLRLDVSASLAVARVTVVGSFAVGLTLRAPRFPAPGETLLARDFDQGPGGKGSNQAVQAARMGAEVEFVGMVGVDSFGDLGRALWAAEGVGTSWLKITDAANTGLGFIMLDDEGENRILLDPGANGLLTAKHVEAAAPSITGADVVVTQLEIPIEAAAAALQIARGAGVKTILNPAPAPALPDWTGLEADFVTPNASEARTMLDRADEDSDSEGLGRALLDLGFDTAILTRGEQGAVIVPRGRPVAFQAPWSTEVVDSTGAGDAFNGTLAAALAAGSPLEDAVDRAAAAGALACTKLGVVPSLPRAGDVAALRQDRR